MKRKIWYTYDEIHRVLKNLSSKIQNSGVHYDAMIAIGGGGFIPARILRTFLNIPIYAITTAYYDSDNLGCTTQQVKKIQWIDPIPSTLIGKNALVIDEVDDTRMTLEFCLNELMKENFNRIDIGVLHEKIKPKKGVIPEGVQFYSGITVEDIWICYPWDAIDIEEHNRLASANYAETHSN